ncbi:MAG: DNA alkylation repair protein [Flavobacteriaceae bacterium]|nr:DNA alkylation repair protein [Flavobacteriaceae bacterium]
MFNQAQREFHYCAKELSQKLLVKTFTKEDIKLIEHLIFTQSWRGSVDAVAKHLLDNCLLVHPDQILRIVNRYSDDRNICLNRSATLYQLGYKEKNNQGILFRECLKHAHSDEFFIKKAIGWSLREYGKVAPNEVISYDQQNDTTLKPLSKKEALKRLS